MNSQLNTWKTRSTKIVFSNDPWLRIERHQVVTPWQATIDDWDFVALPSFVNVMIRMIDGRFLLLQQNKYCCDSPTLGTVSGYIETNENPLNAAK